MRQRDTGDHTEISDHHMTIRPVWKPKMDLPEGEFDLSQNMLDIPTSSHLLSYDHFDKGFVRDQTFLRVHSDITVSTIKLEFTVRWAFPFLMRVFLVRLPTDAGIGAEIVHDIVPTRVDHRVGVNLGFHSHDSCKDVGGLFDPQDAGVWGLFKRKVNKRVKVLKQWHVRLGRTADQAFTWAQPLGRSRDCKFVYQTPFRARFNPDHYAKDEGPSDPYGPPNTHPHFIVVVEPGWNPYGDFAKPTARSPGLTFDRFNWSVYFSEERSDGAGWLPDRDERVPPRFFPPVSRFPGGVLGDDHMDTKEDQEGERDSLRLVEETRQRFWETHFGDGGSSGGEGSSGGGLPGNLPGPPSSQLPPPVPEK